jgi:hypothetical protein
MLTPERLLRLIIEFIFILLGALVAWLGLTGHIFFDRCKPSWLILSLVLILWGARVLYKPGQWWARWENWTRGLSLILLGMVMLAIARVPFAMVGTLLAVSGAILVARGIFASALLFRWQ